MILVSNMICTAASTFTIEDYFVPGDEFCTNLQSSYSDHWAMTLAFLALFQEVFGSMK